jgi:hypothetical protein
MDAVALTWVVGRNFLVLALLGATSWALGARLLRRISFSNPLEQAGFAIALGLGALAQGIFVLALLRVFNTASVLIMLGLAIGVSWREWQVILRGAHSVPARLRGRSVQVTAGAALLIAVPAFILTLYPPSSFDAGLYHLPFARELIAQHGLAVHPFLRYPVFPQLNDLLYGGVLRLAGDVAVQVVPLLMAAAISLLLAGWARAEFGDGSGPLAVALWVGSPLTMINATIALVDMGLAMFVTAAVASVWKWLATQDRRWLVLAAGFCGFAAGTKYLAIPVVVLVAVVGAVVGARRGHWTTILCSSMVFGALAGPWYVRNVVHTGNPVFPFFSSLFGMTEWSLEWSVRAEPPPDTSLRQFDLGAVVRLPVEVGRRVIVNCIGNWRGFLRVPVDLALNRLDISRSPPLSPLFLPTLPFVLVGAFRDRRIAVLLVVMTVYTAIWYSNVHAIRYLLPVIPLLSLAAAASIAEALAWIGRRGGERVRRSAFVLACIAFALPGWLYVPYRLHKWGPVPVTHEARHEYLGRILPVYPALHFLNQRRGDDYTVYALRAENMVYHAEGRFLGDLVGPARYVLVTRHLGSGTALFNELQRLGASHFLVGDPTITLPDDPPFQTHFRLLYEDQQSRLYRLNPVSDPVRRAG